MKSATAIYSTKADQLPAKTIMRFSQALLHGKTLKDAMSKAGITSYCLACELFLRLKRRFSSSNGHLLRVGDLVLVTGYEVELVVISVSPLVLASTKGTIRLTDKTVSHKHITLIGNAPSAGIEAAKRRLFK